MKYITVKLTEKDIRTLLAPISERIKSAEMVLTDEYHRQFFSDLSAKEIDNICMERITEIKYLKSLSNTLAHAS